MATSLTNKFIFGKKDVASAGTAVKLESSNYRVKTVTIIAHSDNAGVIHYGGSDVDSSTNAGLAAGESITITGAGVFDLDDIYIDAGTSNDGVDFVIVRDS
jgi:hypothetical protein